MTTKFMPSVGVIFITTFIWLFAGVSLSFGYVGFVVVQEDFDNKIWVDKVSFNTSNNIWYYIVKGKEYSGKRDDIAFYTPYGEIKEIDSSRAVIYNIDETPGWGVKFGSNEDCQWEVSREPFIAETKETVSLCHIEVTEGYNFDVANYINRISYDIFEDSWIVSMDSGDVRSCNRKTSSIWLSLLGGYLDVNVDDEIGQILILSDDNKTPLAIGETKNGWIFTETAPQPFTPHENGYDDGL